MHQETSLLYLYLVLSRNTLTSGIIFNIPLYCKNLWFLLSIPVLVFTGGCWKHVLSIFFFFFLSSGSYQTEHCTKAAFSLLHPQSVQPMCSPEGLRMLLRFWWWFLISFLAEYMNILLRMFIAVKLLVENRISSPQDLIDGTALFSESWV